VAVRDNRRGPLASLPSQPTRAQLSLATRPELTVSSRRPAMSSNAVSAWHGEDNTSQRRERRARRTTVMLEDALGSLVSDDPDSIAVPVSGVGRTAQDDEDDEGRGKEPCCGAPGLVIHPHTPARQRWDYFILALIVFSTIYDPFNAAFGGKRTAFDWIIDAFYWTDMLLNFLTGYVLDAHSVVLQHHKIVMRYVRGWFAIDFVATMPWDTFMGDGGDVPGLMRLARIIRVLRVLRAGRLLKRLASVYQIRHGVVVIIRFFVGLLMLLHLLACLAYIFYEISTKCRPEEYSPSSAHECVLVNSEKDLWHRNGTDSWVTHIAIDGESQLTQYLISTYFALTTISTVGYGDIVPKNNHEVAYTMMMQLFGLSLFSYTTSTLANLVNGLKAKTAQFRCDTMKDAQTTNDS